jgi:putative FmdB family regulatory protein
MPIYEYSCRKCGGRVEAMQKITAKPLAKHAGCGGRLEKEWSRTGFQFKGTGWYVTDYAGRKSEAKAEGEAGADAKAEAAPEANKTKSDAKADAAPAAQKTSKPKSTSKGASKD